MRLCNETDVKIYRPKSTPQWISCLLEVYGCIQDKVDINVTEVAAARL